MYSAQRRNKKGSKSGPKVQEPVVMSLNPERFEVLIYNPINIIKAKIK